MSELSDSATRYGKGTAARKSVTSGGGRAAKDSRPRPSSFGGSLAQQFSALGLGGGNRMSHQASGGGGCDPRLDVPQQRWSLPRLRQKHESAGTNGGGSIGGGGSGGSTRGGKRTRPRGWTEGFVRSPNLGGLRARAWAAAGSRVGGKARSRSTTRDGGADSTDVSGSSLARGGDGVGVPPAGSSSALRAALAAAEEEERVLAAYDSRYDNNNFYKVDSERASFWQP